MCIVSQCFRLYFYFGGSTVFKCSTPSHGSQNGSDPMDASLGTGATPQIKYSWNSNQHSTSVVSKHEQRHCSQWLRWQKRLFFNINPMKPWRFSRRAWWLWELYLSSNGTWAEAPSFPCKPQSIMVASLCISYTGAISHPLPPVWGYLMQIRGIRKNTMPPETHNTESDTAELNRRSIRQLHALFLTSSASQLVFCLVC